MSAIYVWRMTNNGGLHLLGVSCCITYTHKITLYIFNDGDGFFWRTSCILEKQFAPTVL